METTYDEPKSRPADEFPWASDLTIFSDMYKIEDEKNDTVIVGLVMEYNL